MGFSCTGKRNIAKIVFLSFALTLLLSFNFKAWSGCYLGGGFEDLVITQNAEWNHSVIANREADQSILFSELCHQIPIPGWSGMFFSRPDPLLLRFVQKCDGVIYNLEKTTPILLSVRKDE
ncbi:MAG TPA: hypothetical protein VHR42_02295 [Clostridia bacterium]|nr:hypothetical protein [Clostridia bacterium]